MRSLVSLLRPEALDEQSTIVGSSNSAEPLRAVSIAAEVEISSTSLVFFSTGGTPATLPCHIPMSCIVFFARSEPDAVSPNACSLLIELDHEAEAVQSAWIAAPWVFWSMRYPCRLRIIPEGHSQGDTPVEASRALVHELWSACCCAMASFDSLCGDSSDDTFDSQRSKRCRDDE